MTSNALKQETPTANGPSQLRTRPATGGTFYSTKIKDQHWDRLAIVYVRQSTQHQVLENRQSTARQYALADRALALGWPQDRILVIDEDQGRSGTTTEGRSGFQRLLLEVNLDHVGLILGLEMSRLSRSSKDWHHLLEVCGIFRTLLADQDGLYDPNDPNDRLLLGLKGTLSEAEMHTLRMRLLQGKLQKAQRGELFSMLPTGYVFTPTGEVVLDPDEQAQAVVRLLFEKFEELGTVAGVVRYLARHKICLGFRKYGGTNPGELQWRKACRPTVLDILHHPLYAGAYCYGRHQIDPRSKASRSRASRTVAPLHMLHALKKDCLPAYISWEQFEENQRRIADNRARRDAHGAPRRGKSLLTGLLFCEKCGIRMATAYSRTFASYYCPCQNIDYARPRCQSMKANVIDELVQHQVLEALQPAALELSICAMEDAQRERDRLVKHWQQRLERAKFNRERVERQYQIVEPENRLVARELERRWEQALTEDRQVQEEYERFLNEQPARLTAVERALIQKLADNLPELWRAPSTTAVDRKQIVRHLVEKVVVNVQGKSELVDVAIQWAGGFVSQHQVSRPVRTYEQLQGFEQIRERILELRKKGQSNDVIAHTLNKEGYPTPRGQGRYCGEMIRKLLSRAGLTEPHGLAAWAQKLGENEWSVCALAMKLGIPEKTIFTWCQRKWVSTRRVPTGARQRWICWADSDELTRLRRLRNARPQWPDNTYPPDLTTPKAQVAAK